MLQNGNVQALFTNDPAATSTIEAGIGELVLPETVEVPHYIESPFAFGSFNVRKDWALANTETYQRLVRALNEAVIFVNENPQKAKQTMKPYLPDVFKEHVDKYPDARYLPTNESLPAQFQGIADRYLKMGIIPDALDVSSLIETNEY
jgi:ABC-type nitrate/sulfonate/bicarbonate transport system substrate-binding protein